MNESTQGLNLLKLTKEEIIKQEKILKDMDMDASDMLLSMAAAVDRCAVSKMVAQIFIMKELLKNSLKE